MPDIKLNVPLVGQMTGFDGKPLMQPDVTGVPKKHGSAACWYAAACMVSYYYKKGPRLGLPARWWPDLGLPAEAVDKLAEAEGLVVVPKPAGDLTSDVVYSLLKTYGPIWAFGCFHDKYPANGHAITLTGVQGPFILYNDPWEPRAKKRSWQWIDANLADYPNSMLAKDASRS